MTNSGSTSTGMFPAISGVALITGAASGIGAATVKSFARAGVRQFVLADVQTKPLEKVAEEISAAIGENVEVLAVACDVAKEEDVVAMVAAAVDKFGRIDYAVNAAGIAGQSGPFAQYSFEEYQRVLDINQRGVFLSMREQLKQMAKQELVDGPENPLRRQKGSIVNIASMAGFKGIPGGPGYTSAKHAVVGLAKSAAIEYAAQGIRVNNVAPGWVKTAMTEHVAQAFGLDSLDKMPNVPMKRAGVPEEIADVIVFLSSTHASYVTGVTWQIEGGMAA